MFIDLKLMKSQFLTSSNIRAESVTDFSFCVQAKACSSTSSPNQQMPKESQAPDSSTPKGSPFSGILVYLIITFTAYLMMHSNVIFAVCRACL